MLAKLLTLLSILPLTLSLRQADGPQDEPQPAAEVPAVELPENGSWINLVGQHPTLENTRGQAVILVFFSAGNLSGRRYEWVNLRKFWFEYAEEGVLVLGIFRGDLEGAARVAAEHNLFFPIGVGTDFGEKLGVSSGAHMYLLDKDGATFWAGPLDGLWNGKLLKGKRGAEYIKRGEASLRLRLGGDPKGALGKYLKLCEEGKLAKALKGLDEWIVDPKASAAETESAIELQRKINAHIERCRRQVEALVVRGEASYALEALEALRKELKSDTRGKAVKQRLAELEQDKAFQRELAAERDFLRSYAAYWKRHLSKVKDRLGKILTDYPGTSGARKAQVLIRIG